MKIQLVHDAAVQTIEPEVLQPEQEPITSRDYFLVQNKGFNYYGIDLSSADFSRLEGIISACEQVEKSTWTAQENFYEYLKKSTLLIYTEKDGRVVAFCLVSLLLINDYCFFTNDETMVLKECQGSDLALHIVTTAFLYFMKKLDLGKSIRKFIYVSISANPQVMNSYYRNSYWNKKKYDNSYHPSKELVSIHHAYLEKYSMSLVNPDYPFCVKNLFPGSQHLDWTKKKFQIQEGVKKLMPPEFDHKERGDAWAYMYMTTMMGANRLFLLLALISFGRKAFFNERLGLFRRKKRLLANPKLTRVRLIDGRFGDRRISDRRTADRRTGGTWDNKTERRSSDRRMTDRRNTAQ